MASHRKTDLVVDAVTMAVARRGGHVPGVIHHSDRGLRSTPHTSWSVNCAGTARWPAWAASRTASTALAESAFATLECELFDSQPGGRFQTRRDAKLAVFDFLETFYNPRRGHSALQMRSPLAFEAPHRVAIAGDRSEAASRLPARNDSVTTQPVCASCHSPLPRVRGRQRYCNPACRQRAYRDRHGHPDDIVVKPARGRRSSGVYQCPDWDTRYVGQQRCQDCNVFCTRIGAGGTCPHCEEAVTLDELLLA